MTSAFCTTWSPGLMSGDDLLHLSGKHAAGADFQPRERSIAQGRKDPVAVVQMQNRGRGNRGTVSIACPWKVAVTNIPRRINPGFATSRRTFAVRMVGIENRPDVADAAFENLVGIGVQMNVGGLADVHLR